MSEINIAGAIDKLMIFDDPEYCESITSKKVCRWMIGETGVCRLFDNHILINCRESLKGNIIKYKKCDQCKTAYKKAVGKKIADEFIEDCENDVDTFDKE